MTPTLAGHHQDSISNPPELSDSKEALWGREQPLQQNVYQVSTGLHCHQLSFDAMHSCGRREQCAGPGMLAHCTSLVQPMAGPDPRFSPPPQKRKTRSGYPRLNYYQGCSQDFSRGGSVCRNISNCTHFPRPFIRKLKGTAFNIRGFFFITIAHKRVASLF